MCEHMCDACDMCVCVCARDVCESAVVIHLPEETFPESIPSLHHSEAGLSCFRFHCTHSGQTSLELPLRTLCLASLELPLRTLRLTSLELPGNFLVSSSHLTIGGLGLQMQATSSSFL